MGPQRADSTAYKTVAFIEVTDDVLQKIARNIADAVNPEKIILFGSHARHDARANSDIDLLIIVRDFKTLSRWKTLSAARRSLMDFRVPIDLIAYSEDELPGVTSLRGHVVTTALEEGRVLYERQR